MSAAPKPDHYVGGSFDGQPVAPNLLGRPVIRLVARNDKDDDGPLDFDITTPISITYTEEFYRETRIMDRRLWVHEGVTPEQMTEIAAAITSERSYCETCQALTEVIAASSPLPFGFKASIRCRNNIDTFINGGRTCYLAYEMPITHNAETRAPLRSVLNGYADLPRTTDPRHLLNFLRDTLRSHLTHELDEFLALPDGTRPYDPHRPQPNYAAFGNYDPTNFPGAPLKDNTYGNEPGHDRAPLQAMRHKARSAKRPR